MAPDYEGSDDYRADPGRRDPRPGRRHLASAPEALYLYVDVIRDGPSGDQTSTSAPIVGARLNRTPQDQGRYRRRCSPDRKTAIEAGGYRRRQLRRSRPTPMTRSAFGVAAVHRHRQRPRVDRVHAQAELRRRRCRRSTYVSASLGADFVGNRFADYYFSVSPAESLLGGVLPVYDADGGMKDWKLGGCCVNQSLCRRPDCTASRSSAPANIRAWSATSRTVPICRDRGSASQWLGAIGVAYTCKRQRRLSSSSTIRSAACVGG